MNNSAPITTPKKFIQTLSIIHLALIMGCIIFTVVVYNINKEWVLDFTIKADVFSVLPLVFATSGIFFGAFIYKKMTNSLDRKQTLKEKLIGVQSASIIKFALVEGPTLFSIVIAMVTSNLFYLLLAGLLIFYLISIRPTRAKIEKDLNLKGDLKTQFNKFNEEVV